MTEPASAVEEAARLLAAAQDWIRRAAGPLRDDPGAAAGGSPCVSCPWCQAVRTLRQVRPETVEHLTDAAASLAAALRTVLPAPAGPDAAAPPPGVQHIDVSAG